MNAMETDLRDEIRAMIKDEIREARREILDELRDIVESIDCKDWEGNTIGVRTFQGRLSRMIEKHAEEWR